MLLHWHGFYIEMYSYVTLELDKLKNAIMLLLLFFFFTGDVVLNELDLKESALVSF